TAQVTYIYNGLGQVTKKTEATGDAITYTYDTSGRMVRETRSGFISHQGVNVTPMVNYQYDGLGNLARTVAAGAGDAATRVTRYGYEAGKLVWTIDPSGFQRYHWYDAAGRLLHDEYYTRKDSNGNDLPRELKESRYDAAGRVTDQWVSADTAQGRIFATPVTRYTYNAYGDVTAVNVGTASQLGAVITANRYDAAGRLWATTSGDGVWKFFGYDANGNQTIAITSAGANLQNITSFAQVLALVGQEDVTAAYTVYDNRNLATTVTEEGRRLNATGALETLTSSRSYNAFGEVTSETNALGHTLTYTYNNAGKLIKSESPYVNVTAENGAVSNIRPTENYYYDASGRLVASRDANGNLTRLVLLSGTGYN
ncbi:hypothetical protein ACFOWX_13340, partial [Sphingorhabdus arenilitoris]